MKLPAEDEKMWARYHAVMCIGFGLLGVGVLLLLGIIAVGILSYGFATYD